MISTLTLVGFAAQLTNVLNRLDVCLDFKPNLRCLDGTEKLIVVVVGTGIQPLDALEVGCPVFFYCEGRLEPRVFSHPNCVGVANSLVTLCARLAETVTYLDWEQQQRITALIAAHREKYIDLGSDA